VRRNRTLVRSAGLNGRTGWGGRGRDKRCEVTTLRIGCDWFLVEGVEETVTVGTVEYGGGAGEAFIDMQWIAWSCELVLHLEQVWWEVGCCC
jgi:hypothetical protein